MSSPNEKSNLAALGITPEELAAYVPSENDYLEWVPFLQRLSLICVVIAVAWPVTWIMYRRMTYEGPPGAANAEEGARRLREREMADRRERRVMERVMSGELGDRDLVKEAEEAEERQRQMEAEGEVEIADKEGATGVETRAQRSTRRRG